MVLPVRGAKGKPEADPMAPMNDKFEQMRKEDARLVKGIFQDNEVKGGKVEFFFKKWKGDNIQRYNLEDGLEYELPLAVVKHLNSNCYYQEDCYIHGFDGKPVKNIASKKKHRFSFKISEYC